MGKEQPVDTAGVANPGAETRQSSPHSAFVSANHAVRQLVAKVNLVSRSQASVFITGESGTGKEVIARMIHARSDRWDKPFVAVNCAALPRDVIDNELFGHEKEAFTGAFSRRPGCFEMADGGTLFLDELAEMHPQVQAKLLRAIELKCFRRLGGHEDIDVDVRIIAATNKDVPAALLARELREDVYYRLSVVEVHLPPLRERRDDIPLLIDHFLDLYCEKYRKPSMFISSEALDILQGYAWPGNVRELKNLTESLVLVCPNAAIGPEDLPARISGRPPVGHCISIPLGSSLQDAERLLISNTLAWVGDNKSRAAKILGVSRKSLYDRLGDKTSQPVRGEADGL